MREFVNVHSGGRQRRREPPAIDDLGIVEPVHDRVFQIALHQQIEIGVGGAFDQVGLQLLQKRQLLALSFAA